MGVGVSHYPLVRKEDIILAGVFGDAVCPNKELGKAKRILSFGSSF